MGNDATARSARLRTLSLCLVRSSLLTTRLALCFVLTSGAANAANQGSLAAMSKGSMTITLSVAAQSQASSLHDFPVTNTGLTNGSRQSQEICVWSNTATGTYSVQAEGSTPSGAFALSNGQSAIPYSLTWNGPQGTAVALKPNTALTGLVAVSDMASCAAPATLSLKTQPRNSDGDVMNAGSANFVRLLIAPE